METFVHTPGRADWQLAGGVLRGLRLAAESACEVILLSESPVAELDEILAAAWLFERAGGRAGQLSIASPYPAACWVDAVRAFGVKRVFAVSHRATSGPERLTGMIEVPLQLCPSLAIQVLRDATLSVCGQRASHRVLVPHHFVSRCFSDWSHCGRREERP
jgi:hypothetical protein